MITVFESFNNKNSELILIIGLPGSGKTTLEIIPIYQ
jgi:signal recognition particle GTPase